MITFYFVVAFIMFCLAFTICMTSDKIEATGNYDKVVATSALIGVLWPGVLIYIILS